MKLNNFKIPNLVDLQIKSFKKLIIKNKKGTCILESLFKSFFPIKCKKDIYTIRFNKFFYKKSFFNNKTYKLRGLTYYCKLYINLTLKINKETLNKKSSLKSTQNIYIGDLPFITKNGTFIINGIERVIISQLHRSPGVLFSSKKSKKREFNNKLLYNSVIVPHKGSWLDIEFDDNDKIYFRINKKKKILITVLLRAFNYSNEKILKLFYNKIIFKIKNNFFYVKINYNIFKNTFFKFNIEHNNILYLKKNKKFSFNIFEKLRKKNIKYIKVPDNYVINKILYKDYYNIENKIIANCNTKINLDILKKIKKSKNKYIEVINNNNTNYNSLYISNTLKSDKINSKKTSLIKIYNILYPKSVLNKKLVNKTFKNYFFNIKTYNLSKIGRLKINKSLNFVNNNNLLLTKKDIINVIKKLINIRKGIIKVDDIDDLSNRRLRLIGELIENQFKILFTFLIKTIKKRLSLENFDRISFQDMVNSNFITLFIKKFFCSHELSQFIDQTNPLSEITHKRRISALGPGGLIRERASFDVRDVHPSYYGRICPIESPEGTNIGLINSLSIYSKVDKYGFIRTPYYKVKNGKVTNKIVYLLSNEEEKYIIAQANNKLNKKNFFIKKFIICRNKKETNYFHKNNIDYIDVSSQQILSIAVSLIPFLEHNDANRVLMGANMLRQSVPLLKSERPLVKTGMEKVVSKNANLFIKSKINGKVTYLDHNKIIVRKKDRINIYNLKKNLRSNQDTFLNYSPCINILDKVKIGDLIAESNCSNLYDLSLGKNVRVAFMSWRGYNFEDSILISERLIKKETFTSVHVKEFICFIRNTKYGLEKITNNISNIKYNETLNLNKNGIINVGSIVKEGDILVGKVTPIKNLNLTPEEKLLNKIFKKDINKFKDTSLRVPNGIKGVVIKIKVTNDTKKEKKRKKNLKKKKKYIKKNLDKEKREKEKIKREKEKIKREKENKDLLKEYKILKLFFINKVKKILLKNKIKFNGKLNFNPKKLNIKSKYIKIISKLIENYNYYLNVENKIINNKKEKENYELPLEIHTLVKVYIAIKKYIQPGDKISGRHGNKGIVSKINSIEDMPYDKNGIPIDIILNPLGIPSRMNVGQVLEVHLGLASKNISNKINNMIKENKDIKIIRKFLIKVYKIKNKYEFKELNLKKFSDKEILKLAKKNKKFISFISPVFKSIKKKDIKKLLKLSGTSKSGQITLYDGCTGEKFDKKITVGYMYILKLNHLVEDKIHSRSTGPYSLITQQPLGGKSQFGGQRFGEMEVWALEAYGAANILQEMITVKSDDLDGRNKIYKNILKNKEYIIQNVPESFSVLIKEIKSLGISIDLLK